MEAAVFFVPHYGERVSPRQIVGVVASSTSQFLLLSKVEGRLAHVSIHIHVHGKHIRVHGNVADVSVELQGPLFQRRARDAFQLLVVDEIEGYHLDVVACFGGLF